MAESRRVAAARALRPGHRLTLLAGGTALFDALVEAVDAARVEVLLETYIFEFAGATLAVAESLARAAERGVTVRIVVDGIGTGDIPGEWQRRWAAAGVHWRIFNPARGWRVLLPGRWRRMHRKLCVVDGTLAFCGGINLLDDYVDPTHGRLDEPRFDFAVRARGPLVDDAHETMTRLWLRMQVRREARHFDFKESLAAVRAAARAGTDMDDATMTAGNLGRRPGPAEPGQLAGLALRDNVRFRRRIEHFYRFAIAQAKREIIIANAYFVPGLALQRALLAAARRGVRITLLLQGRYEYFMQHHTSRAMYGPMLEAGITIIEYAPSFLHAKVAVFDSVQGWVATVGSSNLDPLSLLLAREANVFVRDDAFAEDLRAHLLDAAAHAGTQVEPAGHSRRPWRLRGLSWIAYAMMRIALFATRNRY
ncbi:MAG: cardiolipin synthase ClsB [Caldimonas sp.]